MTRRVTDTYRTVTRPFMGRFTGLGDDDDDGIFGASAALLEESSDAMAAVGGGGSGGGGLERHARLAIHCRTPRQSVLQ